MITTQRIIMIVLAINVMIGIVTTMYHDPTTFRPESITEEINYLEANQQNMTSEEGIWGSVKTTTVDVVKTIGNVIKWGYTILTIFIRGMNPLSITPSMFTNKVMQIAAYAIILTRCFITTILGYEMYQVFKNKKTS